MKQRPLRTGPVGKNGKQSASDDGKAAAPRTAHNRRLDARPDTLDFRDRMYDATLIDVAPERPLGLYLKVGVPVLDQGTEGACTGFGLATVVNYLLRQHGRPGDEKVSPRMLYEMARRYDEWPGQAYDGSSARGAMKGWHKHGVCSSKKWPYSQTPDSNLTADRAADALRHPLGAYYRVNHRDLICMHAAMAEVGILYATAQVHTGWENVGTDGIINQTDELLGGHAFAIVGYDDKGFWLQNSWGSTWGQKGFGHVTYDDWLANGTDVWVARLGVPVESLTLRGGAALAWGPAGHPFAYTQNDLRPHIVSTGNNGRLRPEGPFGSTAENVKEIFTTYFPAITSQWKKKRILLFTHGGLVSEESAIQRLAENRAALLAREIYPISFVWKTDYWTTITNILKDAMSRRTSGGVVDASKDFMLDRLDDALEPLARVLTGKAEWDEMKENALAATTAASGGARLALDHLNALIAADPAIEIHLIGHSAGAIYHAAVVQYLTAKGTIAAGPMKGQQGLNRKIKTCTLWAPACTTDLFKEAYLPAINSGAIGDFALFTLKDRVERDDHCAKIYHKSLLYLVSNAFEKRFRIPLIRPDGEPILGMEKFVRADKTLTKLFDGGAAEWVLTPNAEPHGSARESTARHHGDFDNDDATLRAALARMLGTKTAGASTLLTHRASTAALQVRMSNIASASAMRLTRR